MIASPKERRFLKYAAKELNLSTEEIEIDYHDGWTDAQCEEACSISEEGAFVAAWVWVSADDLPE